VVTLRPLARVAASVAALALVVLAPAASGAPVEPGFQEVVVFNGLTNPTAVRFFPDGRVLVAEKSGLIKIYDSVVDSTSSTFADLRTPTHDFWDRGLLGLAIDPQFPARPYVYALYAYNKDPNSATFPRWPDGCPTPPGATGDGCVVTGRLSRLTVSGSAAVAEQVLLEDWCQQYPSHSVGALAFGNDGALYVSGGDGASFNFADYGQDGSPVNPCGDPPGPPGTALTPPTAEGGALRSQDVRTTGDPTGLGGSILRIDPDTGAGLPDNPLALSPDPNRRRIVATGLRNPFRIAVRPGTNEVWAGDVGWNIWEELNRVQTPNDATVDNFGWPCYEGGSGSSLRMPSYDNLNLSICENLYADPNAGLAAAHFAYRHADKVVVGETCPTGGSSVSGLAFYESGTFPGYAGALFFADYSRSCIWVMFAGANGLPDPATRRTFVAAAAAPVDLQVGPDGALYYADLVGGTVRRVQWTGSNNAPTAALTATPSSGPAPLTVDFDARGSSDPDPGTTLTYAWDLDGDGAFDDGAGSTRRHTYAQAVEVDVRVRVTDQVGASDVATVRVSAGNTPPNVTLVAPAATLRWNAGDTIAFSATATDAQETLPPSAFDWSVVLQHCAPADPGSCHVHQVQDFPDVASGSFGAPGHEYPAYLELTVTATDSGGLSDTETVRIDPRSVQLTFATQPAGLDVSVGSFTGAGPFVHELIVGTQTTIAAPPQQTVGGTTYTFESWSDGGAAAHALTAPASPATYTARYVTGVPAPPPGLVGAWGFDEVSGPSTADASGRGNTGTISGAARSSSGRFGGALSFDGVNDWVTVPDASSLDLTTGMTLEAWVNPTVNGDWRTVVFKESPGFVAYSLYSSEPGNVPITEIVAGGAARNITGLAPLPLNTWSHLAATYGGGNLRLYVNGALVRTAAVTGSLAVSTQPLRFGGNGTWGEWFAGRIDEVRVYERALSQAEIQADMNAPVGTPPAPPGAPQALTATGAIGRVNLTWGAASGAVDHYDVHRSTVAGFTPSVANRVGQSTSTSYADLGLAPGTYHYRVIALNAAGAAGPPSNQASGTALADTTPPTVALTEPSNGATVSGTVAVSATAGDDVGVAGVRFEVDGAAIGVEDTTAPYSVQWDSRSVAPGPHSLSAIARDAAGNLSTRATVGVTVAAPPPPPSALVAAYSFSEAGGATTADATGKGHTGTLTGAAFTLAGRNGGGMFFDGGDWVTIADANDLDLTNQMTLTAWVNPSAHGQWRTVIFKETPGSVAYSLYTSESAGFPISEIFAGGFRSARGPAALPLGTWSHLAATYDGASLRLYVNGALAQTTPVTGNMTVSTGPLRLGGNAVWGEYFTGTIDDVRIYDRARTQAEIQSDLATPVAP
jgi:glucose/arabinose dehydrogenase